jgi:cyclopropane fatty-acyl-phospholipid synthase-like methyltransferase
LVSRILSDRGTGGTLLDVGCGRGDLWPHVADRFAEYHGADVICYDGFPDVGHFHHVDLDAGRVAVDDGFADVVVAVETIEHLENPRAFARELTRLAKAGGWIVVTTPNQLSLLSKLTLSLRHEFSAFRAGNYPAHLTALLEVDLRRITAECGWEDVDVEYTARGRMPGTGRHWPGWLSRRWPRGLSDNVAIIGRKPGPD